MDLEMKQQSHTTFSSYIREKQSISTLLKSHIAWTLVSYGIDVYVHVGWICAHWEDFWDATLT